MLFKFGKSSKVINISFLLIVIAITGCSPVRMSLVKGSSSGGTLIIEDGKFATSKNALHAKINVNEIRFERFNKIRFAEKSAFTPDLPWQPYVTEFDVKLANEWAEDGSKDGTKTIIAEVGTDFNPPTVVRLEGQILLDTIPPQVSLQGFLANGLNGLTHNLGESVELKWKATDTPSKAGISSGLDTSAGLRIGWSDTSDCSAGVNITHEWQPYSNSISNFSWPKGSSLDSFYICIFVRDFAGNISTGLSQPMTTIWSVLVGDNNLGNGGSVYSKNVRFNYPTTLAHDSKGSLYFSDSYSNLIRKIDGSTKTISVFAGNGDNGTTVAGDALSTPLSLPTSTHTSLGVDKYDRVFIVSGDSIWRITPGSGSQKPKIFKYASPPTGSGRLSLAVDAEKNILYVGRYKNFTGTTADEAALYKINIDEVENDGSLPIDLVSPPTPSKYIFSGNGMGLAKGSPSVSESLNSEMDYVSSIAAGPNESIFVATEENGNGIPFGNHALYTIYKDPNDFTFKKKLLCSNISSPSAGLSWLSQMLYLKAENKLLIGSFRAGVKVVDLNLPGCSISQNPNFIAGTTVQGLSLFDKIYVSESELSKISIYDASLNSKVGSYGRDVYDSGNPDSPSTPLNLPVSVAQGSDETTYFFDALTNAVRSSSKDGITKLVAGNPVPGAPPGITSNTDVPFSSFTVSGLPATFGYQFHMQFVPSLNSLFMGDGNAGRIIKFDLNTQIARTYGTVPLATDLQNTWPVGTLSFNPLNNSIGAFRYFHISPFGSMLKEYSGLNGDTVTVISGTGIPADPVVGPAISSPLNKVNAAAYTPDGILYFASQTSGLYRINLAGNLDKMSNQAYKSLTLYKEFGTTHIFGLAGKSVIYSSSADGFATSAKLCFPNTNLNDARQINTTADGNLIIADSHNNRILKYFIRDADKNISLQFCP